MRACFRSGQNQATALSRSVASTCCGFDERNAQWLRVRSPALCCCSKPQLLFVSEKCCSSADFYSNAFQSVRRMNIFVVTLACTERGNDSHGSAEYGPAGLQSLRCAVCSYANHGCANRVSRREARQRLAASVEGPPRWRPGASSAIIRALRTRCL